MKKLKVNDIEISYNVIGEGAPLIFTHGHSMNGKQWEPQIKALCKEYQCVIWDVRGHGSSTLPPGKGNPDDFSRDLVALMDYLNIEKAVLCGLSMGGHISVQCAIHYPERVSGLILIGTPYTNKYNWFEKYATPISLLSLRLLPFHWTASWIASAMSRINPANKAYVLESFQCMTKANFLAHWEANLKMESGPQLHKVSCPTMILLGSHDKMVARQQKSLRKGIPHSEYYTIPAADHLTNRDNPKAVTNYIHQFMKAME